MAGPVLSWAASPDCSGCPHRRQKWRDGALAAWHRAHDTSPGCKATSSSTGGWRGRRGLSNGWAFCGCSGPGSPVGRSRSGTTSTGASCSALLTEVGAGTARALTRGRDGSSRGGSPARRRRFASTRRRRLSAAKASSSASETALPAPGAFPSPAPAAGRVCSLAAGGDRLLVDRRRAGLGFAGSEMSWGGAFVFDHSRKVPQDEQKVSESSLR